MAQRWHYAVVADGGIRYLDRQELRNGLSVPPPCYDDVEIELRYSPGQQAPSEFREGGAVHMFYY